MLWVMWGLVGCGWICVCLQPYRYFERCQDAKPLSDMLISCLVLCDLELKVGSYILQESDGEGKVLN